MFNSYPFHVRRKNWVLRPAHEWLMTFSSYLLIDKSLSNCRKRGFCLIFKLGFQLFWIHQFQNLCAYMKLLCIRHPFQLSYKEKSNFCNFEFLDKFEWKQPEWCRSLFRHQQMLVVENLPILVKLSGIDFSASRPMPHATCHMPIFVSMATVMNFASSS